MKSFFKLLMVHLEVEFTRRTKID
jgi:hypothetical protein